MVNSTNSQYSNSIRTGLIYAAALAFLLITALGLSSFVSAVAPFDKNHLIDDALFIDHNSMSVAEIQTWLNNNGGTLLANWVDNVDMRRPSDNCIVHHATGMTAAQIIYESATTWGAQVYDGNGCAISGSYWSDVGYSNYTLETVSPKALLVMLQKEQSLISANGTYSTDPNAYKSPLCCSSNEYKLARATGYGVPDSGSINEKYLGFYNQVNWASWQLRFNFERSSGNTDWDEVSYLTYSGPMIEGTFKRCGSCSAEAFDGYYPIDGAPLYIDNRATASLYYYTPHTYPGFFGNYNFVQFYTTWFGPTNRSVLFKIDGSGTYYLEWADQYYPIPSSEILVAFGLSNIAPRVESQFPNGKTRGPALQRSVKFGSDDPMDSDYTAQVNVIDNGKIHAAPNAMVLSAHGLGAYSVYEASLDVLLVNGDNLTMLTRTPNGAIHLIESNKKRGFPNWKTFSTLSGPNAQNVIEVYSEQALTNMSSQYVNSKSIGAPMLLDGYLVSSPSTSAIYLIENAQKRLLTAQAYSAWGGKTDFNFNINSLSQIPSGSTVPILIKSTIDETYFVSGGNKYNVAPSEYAAWSVVITDFEQMTDEAITSLPNKTLTNLIKSGSPGIYVVEGSQKHGIPSLTDFSRLGLQWSNLTELHSSIVNTVPRGPDKYAPGALVRTPNGATFMMNAGYEAHGVTSGALFTRFGLKWPAVHNVSSNGLAGFSYSPLETTLFEPGSGLYYIVESGVFHKVKATDAGAGVYNLNAAGTTSIDPKVLDTLTRSSDMTRFLRGGGPTVYYIENGTKRPLATEAALFSSGGSWGLVMDVSDEYLDELPRGAAIF